MNKTYVEFLLPGSFFPEAITREVADRSPPQDIPRNTFGYSFFSRTVMQQDGETLIGPVRERSPTTYFGEVMAVEQVEALPGDHEILLSNMRINGWSRVVRTTLGNFRPLEKGDSVIAASQAAEERKS